MSTAQIGALNAEIQNNLDILSQYDDALQRVAKYLRRVVRQMTSDPTEFTKEEFFARIDKAKEGPTYTLAPGESIEDLIARVGV